MNAEASPTRSTRSTTRCWCGLAAHRPRGLRHQLRQSRATPSAALSTGADRPQKYVEFAVRVTCFPSGNMLPLLHISKQATFGKGNRCRSCNDEVIQNFNVHCGQCLLQRLRQNFVGDEGSASRTGGCGRTLQPPHFLIARL